MANSATSGPQSDSVPNGAGRRIGIVAAQWHSEIVDLLLHGAVTTLRDAGVRDEDVIIVRCPGSFEIPVCVITLADAHQPDAIITLGVVIRGDTAHFEYVSSPVAHSIMNISVETGIPCLFGVLTTENVEQALERAGGIHGNKGAEAAIGALRMADTLDKVRSEKP